MPPPKFGGGILTFEVYDMLADSANTAGDVIVFRGPKVSLVASESTWIEGDSLRQLDSTADLEGMIRVVGMPDLHPGKGGPVGAAYLSDGFIHPTLVGSDIGCGMRLDIMDIDARKLKIDRIVERLQGLDLPWDGDRKAWLEARQVPVTEHDETLGTPGRGNHFIELQAVDRVIDEAAFDRLRLCRDKVHLLVHSGSRGFGEAILRSYAERFKAEPLKAGTEEFGVYLERHDHAMRWAEANRELCAARACEAVGAESINALDICHNSVTSAVIGGCGCWLHRKGAAPADKGPIMIPGSRGDLSWLVEPVHGRDDALRSLAHGAGRKIARSEAKGKLANLYQRADLRRNRWGGRVVCGEDLLAWEEAPEAYKPIDSVVGDLFAAGLARPIAAFRPLVTFKTSDAVERKVRRESSGWKRDREASRRLKGSF
jgi:release factor H-coupled RctB family protein